VGVRVLDRVRQLGVEIDKRQARRRTNGTERVAASANGHGPLQAERAAPLVGERRSVDVWLAAGTTDMRKGPAGLVRLAQRQLALDSSYGQLFVFRGRAGEVHVLRWDLTGLSLFNRRMSGERLSWPATAQSRDTLEAPELSALLAEIDWKHPVRTKQISPGTRCHRATPERRKTSSRMLIPTIARVRLWQSEARLSQECLVAASPVTRRHR
jgi:transposase